MRNINTKANFTAPLISAARTINEHYGLSSSGTDDTAHCLLAQFEVIFEVMCDDPIAFVEDNPQVLKVLYSRELQKKDSV